MSESVRSGRIVSTGRLIETDRTDCDRVYSRYRARLTQQFRLRRLLDIRGEKLKIEFFVPG